MVKSNLKQLSRDFPGSLVVKFSPSNAGGAGSILGQQTKILHVSQSKNQNIKQTVEETQMYRTDFWTLWEKARVGCFKRTASKHVYYLGWNRSPAQVGCMRQVLRPGALGSPRGIGWRGRLEEGAGWGTHVNPWLIHVNVWQKPLQNK